MSVVICAYNEEAVVGRCLQTLTCDASPGELEVVVVCNGCTDDTAPAARAAYPAAMVVETAQAGKARALNIGDAHASYYPRFYVDADVEVDVHALRDVAAVMEAGDADCAAPVPRFDLSDRNWAIRSFYRVWSRLPYLNDSVVGSGVYALTEAGRARFGEFPDLTADDQFVMQHFAADRRRSVRDAAFTIHVPARLADLVAVRTRVYRGNAELAAAGAAPEGPTGGRSRALARLLLRPSLVPAVAVYVAVNLVATRRARQPALGWERDDSSRAPEASSGASRVAYLVSRYPSISHTFILREVGAVRAAGLYVDTFSVVRTPDRELLAPADRAAAASTWSIRPVGRAKVLAALARLVVSHPSSVAGTAWLAVSDAPAGFRARVWRLFYFAEAVLLAAECRRRGIRHIHAHLANVASDVAWLCADLGQRIDGRGAWSWSLSVHGPTELLDTSRFHLASKVRRAALVLCITDFARSQLMALVGPEEWSKLHVVHMGVDLGRYPRPSGPRHSDRTGECLILCVGRLDPVKGQAVLLDAVATLVAEGQPLRLVIVGGGPAESALREQIEKLEIADRVELTGPLGQDDVVGLYADADLFCLPSFAEGLPVVLMEALASELPVVTTPIAGIPELVSDGVNGLLVPPGRVDRLAEALRALVDDPSLRRRMGASGRRAVVESFDAADCGRDVARLLGAQVARTRSNAGRQ